MPLAPRSALAAVLGASLFAGCGGSLDASRRLEPARRAASCERISEAALSARRVETRGGADVFATMPRDVRRVAEAARLDDATLADRTAILERAILLQAEISAAGAEVDCLADQLEDLQDEMDDRAAAFTLTVTLASIAVAALTGTVSGILDLTMDEEAVSLTVQIAGGATATALGVIAFFPPDQTVTLDHERNLLRAVHELDEEAVRSGLVLELLRAPRGGGPSPRETLELRWADLLEPLGPDAPARFFGDGGPYDREALHAREVALELLEAEIALVRQDLELLLRFLLRRP